MGRNSRIGFVVGAVVAFAAALAVGIDDNLPGIALMYVASVSLVLAIAHRWRRVKPFLWLLVGSLVLFPVAAVLHNAFYALGELAGGLRVLKSVLDALHAAFFLTAILLSPAGVVVGAVGSLVTWSRSHRAA